jgi:osmotically-inducible protein OsmY
MRGFSTGLLLGVVLGAAGFWFVQKKAHEHPEAQQRYEDSAAHLRTSATEAARNMSDALRAKLDTLDLRSDQINDELTRNGKIFRRKAQDIGDQVVTTVSDARAIVKIKAKCPADATLSVWSISAGCTQGHVILSGTVASPDDIGRAVALALDTDGVRDVASTLEVKPKA